MVRHQALRVLPALSAKGHWPKNHGWGHMLHLFHRLWYLFGGTWGEIKNQMEIMLKRWKWAIIWYVSARGWESLSIFAGRIDYYTNVLYLFSASQNCSWKLKTRATSMPQTIGRHALGTCRRLYMLVGSINRPSLVSHVFGRDPLSVHAVPSIQAKSPEIPHIPAVTEIGGAEAAKGKGRLVKLKRQAEGFLLGSGVNVFFGGSNLDEHGHYMTSSLIISQSSLQNWTQYIAIYPWRIFRL